MTITVSCPSCSTSFPVDPAKIPEGGVNARCSSCGNVFFVEKPDPFAGTAAVEPTPDEVTPPAGDDTPDDAYDTPDDAYGTPDESYDRPDEAHDTPDDAYGMPDDAFSMPDDEGSERAGDEPSEDDFATPAEDDDDWVIEREPGMTGGGDQDVGDSDRVETVERSQDPGYFGGPSEDIETTEVASSGSDDFTADEDEVDDAEPMVSGSFETGGLDTGGLQSEDDAGGWSPTDSAPPETPASPDVSEPEAAPGAPGDDIAGAGPQTPDVEEGRAPETLPEPEEKPQGFQFGKRDPHEKARRLARVLVSDMIMYNPERHSRALEQGSLQADFEEEIKKSWSEFVDQVGDEIAHNSSYFTDALNDILAKGEQVFHGQPGS